MVLPRAQFRNAPPKKQAECDKFIDHAQIADGYFCVHAYFVSVIVPGPRFPQDSPSFWSINEAIVDANRMRFPSKPARISLKSFKIVDFEVVCSGLGFPRPGNIR